MVTGAAMLRTAFIALWLCAVLTCPVALTLAAPPGPEDLTRSIETARKTIAEHEKALGSYDVEMRAMMANDPASVKRREEIRIIKQHYVREIENLKAKIASDYKKIQEHRSRGVQ